MQIHRKYLLQVLWATMLAPPMGRIANEHKQALATAVS